MDEEMQEVIGEFLVESYENLDRMDQEFVALEADPNNPEVLQSIFRTIHTIKGTSGFLAFENLEKLTHIGENLLSKLRDGALALNGERTTALLQMVDAVRNMLTEIEQSGTDGTNDYAALKATLASLTESESAPATAETPAATAAEDFAPVAVGASAVAVGGEVVETPAPPASPDAPAAPNAVSGAGGGSVADSSIRVDVGLLDQLMNLVSELVLARNQILQHAGSVNHMPLSQASQQLNLLTSELQEGVMKTRMQPIGNVWNKFPRVVRDLSQSLGKQVRLEMEGKETDLDKTILEAIKDPLTHLVRNSIDHGIEMPDKRQERGKNPEGVLLLRAYHEGGMVNIEIVDDGGGIDSERVKQKAIEKGVITPDQASKMVERDLVNLIFMPGFSTAEQVTNVSGRGVGMDVVRTNIEKIGGSIDVNSKLGEGSVVKIKIPLTLAIIPAIIITSGAERYAIPQVSLLELVRLEENSEQQIEMVHGAPVYRLRDQLLPIVYLNEVLGSETSRTDDGVNIVVLKADERTFGMVVDKVNDTAEIVVKPLAKLLKSADAFSGATIMGDGRVVLILDVIGIAQRASVIVEGTGSQKAADTDLVAAEADGSQKQTLLLTRIGATGRAAIPLSQVNRLEEFSREAIETAVDQQVVQYRGTIMPLVDAARVVSPEDAVREFDETVPVVVVMDGDRPIGLVVDDIVDIVEEKITMHQIVQRNGVAGSIVVQGQVADVLDPIAVVNIGAGTGSK